MDLDEDLLFCPTDKLPHTEYLDMINRGGMKTPSTNVVYSVSACYAIFQTLISKEFEQLFTMGNIPQHSLLLKLTELYLKQSSTFNFE